MTMEPSGTGGSPALTPSGSRPGVSWGSLAWAASPLVTLGLCTWATFLYAAIRRRSAWLAGTAALYAVLLAVWMVAAAPAHPGPVGSAVAGVGLIVSMIGGFVNALAVRGRVFSPPPRLVDPLRDAEQEALRRRELRREGRDLLSRDPGLAGELCIGRPDLHRSYDDGGLVDVNHVPAEVLATLPGMTPELAARAVQLRGTRGPFVSADDLSEALDLNPQLVPQLADLTIYPA